MKDPNDKSTIDGFASLLRELDEHPAESKPAVRPGVSLSDLAMLIDHVEGQLRDMPPEPSQEPKTPRKRAPGAGRKPKGEVAATPAERKRASRERQRLQREAETQRLADIRAGKPVRSLLIDLDTGFADLLRERAQGKPGA